MIGLGQFVMYENIIYPNISRWYLAEIPLPTRINFKAMMDYQVWDETTHPSPNFNGDAVEVWEWISNFVSH